jgi:hypothetical protein
VYKVTRAQGIIYKGQKIFAGQQLPDGVHADFIERHKRMGWLEEVKQTQNKQIKQADTKQADTKQASQTKDVK